MEAKHKGPTQPTNDKSKRSMRHTTTCPGTTTRGTRVDPSPTKRHASQGSSPLHRLATTGETVRPRRKSYGASLKASSKLNQDLILESKPPSQHLPCLNAVERRASNETRALIDYHAPSIPSGSNPFNRSNPPPPDISKSSSVLLQPRARNRPIGVSLRIAIEAEKLDPKSRILEDMATSKSQQCEAEFTSTPRSQSRRRRSLVFPISRNHISR
ncbi:hypothetical protein Rs2_36632 [Raphanus sativus]|nr:hypothetical protein Rs2_36632 [Raphanus sativus]